MASPALDSAAAANRQLRASYQSARRTASRQLPGSSRLATPSGAGPLSQLSARSPPAAGDYVCNLCVRSHTAPHGVRPYITSYFVLMNTGVVRATPRSAVSRGGTAKAAPLSTSEKPSAALDVREPGPSVLAGNLTDDLLNI
jgi:hypothetical protein